MNDSFDALKHSLRNRGEIERSKLCGCYCCAAVFDTEEIVEWVDGALTAICPHCGIDAVIGDASGITIDRRTLKMINKRYF